MNGCLVAGIFKQILKKNETTSLTRREEKKSERVSMVAKNKKQNKQTLKMVSFKLSTIFHHMTSIRSIMNF